MKYLPALGAALVAVVFVVGGLRETKLDCDRTRCTYDERTFRVADVRDVRFVDRLGKNGGNAETVLVFASGHELRLGHARTDDARATFQQLRSFFSPTGASTYTTSSKGSPWMLLLAAACAIAAVVLGVKAYRAPDTHRPPDQARFDWSKYKKHALTVGGIIVIAGIGQLVLMGIASKTQGTLVLECKQRCRFDGMECLPGGGMRTTLDEGTYQIEIWASSGSALWIPKTLEIVTGETTEYVCQ